MPVKNSISYQTVPALSWWAFSVYVLLMAVGVAIVGYFGWWWFSLAHIPSNFTGIWHGADYILFALLSYVVWYQIGNELLTWVNALFMRHPVPMEPAAGLKVALATAFVPGKEPYDVLENTIKAMVAVRYPHDTWILDEGNDETVKQLCRMHGAKHFSRHGITSYNTPDGHFKARTKAGNYNSWFDAHGHTYDIVAQHDVDFVPDASYLEKTLGYFKDEKVAFVGTPQIYGNVDESWVARGAAEQAYGFYGSLQKGLFGLNMQLFIGANHVIRVAAHDSIGGYSGHIVEDHLTGMRLYANGWKSVYVPEVLLVGEGPATWDAYFSQQMRWAYGLIDILFRHSPKLVFKMRPVHALNYLALQQYYFFGIAQLIGVFLIGSYFIFGLQSGVMDLTTLLIWYPLFLIMQIVIFLWLQLAYIEPRKESGFHIAGKLLNIAAWPIFALACASAIVGKKLNYQVTPKGSAQEQGAPHIGLFGIHFLIGVVTSLFLMASFFTGYHTPMLTFWAIVTIVSMFSFVMIAASARVIDACKRILPHVRDLVAINTPWTQSVVSACIVFVLMAWGGVVFTNSLSSTEQEVLASGYDAVVKSVLAINTTQTDGEDDASEMNPSILSFGWIPTI